MFRRVSQIVSLLLAAALLCTPAFGAQSAPVDEGSSSTKFKSRTYGYPDESNLSLGSVATERPSEGVSLGSPTLTSPFVGVKIGDTYYDYQHNGRMARMVDWGNDIDDGQGLLIHFEWMRLATEVQENRHYAYNVYYTGGPDAGTMLGQTKIQPDGEYAGYVSLDVTNDSRAVLGGHNNQGSGYQPHTYWDFGPIFAFFGGNSRVPDSVIAAGTGQNVNDSLKSAMWPSIRYQEGPTDTVLHVFTQVKEAGAGDPQAIIYFRKVGTDWVGEWDYPPYIVDTVFDIAQDVACSNVDGKVALVWIANLPDPGDCDTCSSNAGRPFSQWDNDIYYQISHDQGATFSPRVNLTMNIDGEEGYRPYADLSALIGSDNDLCIAWNGRYWPADANQGGDAGSLRCRMFYWGENLGWTGNGANIRTVTDLGWNQTNCDGGAWQLNGSKMTISECDGKLYYLWTQFNDVRLGIEDDCAERAYGEEPDVHGAANGELYLAVSDDGGLTWDGARNLTNTYTPHCDPAAGPDSACRSEHWASMARFGTNLTGDMSGAYVLDPSGGYTGDYFLDVQYIGDKDPGGIGQNEGSWQQADVMWFRLPCVEPEPFACVTSNLWAIWTHTEHGVPIECELRLENSCNLDANYTMTILDESGPPGWLTASLPEVGVIPAGGLLEGTVTINTGGIVNEPGTYVQLRGGLMFEGDFDGSPLGIYISCDVIPEIYELWPDTLSTGCLSLIVRGNGSYGGQGAGKVNMDFFNSGDCDTVDSIPGETDVYLYDGSPVICWPDGDSVRCNWSIFGNHYSSDNVFLPVSQEPTADSGDFYYYQSTFTTRDAGIGVQQSWYAPKDQPDSCQFLIHRWRVFSNDEQTHTNVAIGEAIDWDIPSDTASRNNSGFNTWDRLVYQSGSEYNDDDNVECMDNDDRFGGISLVHIVGENGAYPSEDLYGAYSADNATQVYPYGGLVDDSVWHYIGQNEGYVMSDSTNADLHSVITYRFGHTLAPGDTLDIMAVLATSRGGLGDFFATVEAGHEWVYNHIGPTWTTCCVGKTGNIDCSGDDAMDISDLVYLVDYMFTGGPLCCFEEADVNCDGQIDISDLVDIVDCMFGMWPCEFCDCPPPEWQ